MRNIPNLLIVFFFALFAAIPAKGQPLTVLQGTITNQTTGQPVSGAAVTLYGATLVTINTDVNGSYAFTGQQWPYTGPVTMWIVAPGYFTPVLSVNIATPFPVTVNRALIVGGPVIRGAVTDASTGAPVANGSVAYSSGSFYPGAGTRAVQTDISGNYSIDSSQFDESAATTGMQVSLTISKAGYLQTSVSVNAAPPYPVAQNFSLTPGTGTLLQGTVTNQITGQPVSGAAVTLYGPSLVTVNTDANGKYAFTGQQWPYTGSATMWIVAPGYFTPVLSVNIATPFPVTVNRALIVGGAVIRGAVTDASTGGPVANASVAYSSGSFYPGAGTRAVQTDISGNYSIDSSQFNESTATTSMQASLTVSSQPGYLQTSTAVTAHAPYPLTQNFSLLSAGVTEPITVATSPGSLNISVDGVSYVAPQIFNWVPGNPHTIATSSPQPGPSGTQYVFGGWSSGAAISQTIVTPGASATYTASFVTQYQLTTSVTPGSGGSITAGGWFNSGTTVSIQATANPGYQFIGFSGNLNGSTTQQNLLMNGPKSVVARFAANTTTAVTSSLNPSTYGQSVTLSATVMPQSVSGTPTGSVTFYDGATSLGVGQLNGGVATFSTAALAAGTHSISATYAGDSNFASSASGTLSQAVNTAAPPPPITLTTNAGVSVNGGATATIGSSLLKVTDPGDNDGWLNGTILVAHQKTDSTHVISQIAPSGGILKQFGSQSLDRFRTHLALAGGLLYRSNDPYDPVNITTYDSSGQLVSTITVNSSAQHEVSALTRDAGGSSIFFVDVFAGSNVIRRLTDAVTGANDQVTTISYNGAAGVQDLYYGGPAASAALYALSATSPGTGPYRIAKFAGGPVQFFDSPDLTVPFVTDFGSIAVDPNAGTVYAATTAKIISFNQAGQQTGGFPFVDSKPSVGVDQGGNIYATHFDSGTIAVFTPGGTLVRTITLPSTQRVIHALIAPGPMIVYTLTASPTHGTLMLAGASLQPGATFTQADIESGALTYRNDGSAATSDGFSYTASNGTTSISSTVFPITVIPVPVDLEITSNTAAPLPAMIDTPLTFTIVITNRSASYSATGVNYQPTMPGAFDVIGNASATQGTCGTVNCSLGTLGPGASATITVQVLPTGTGTNISNIAHVTANEYDPNTANNILSGSYPVSKAAVTATVSANPPAPLSGATVTLTASVFPTSDPAAYGGRLWPTGVVTFFDGGTIQLGTASLANGSASLSTSSLAAGSHSITVVYAGDSNYLGSISAALPLTIGKADQSISFGALPGKTYGDPPFTVAATASSGLAVIFSAAGTCTVSGALVTITGAGSCTIAATQPGDGYYNAAAPVSQGFAIAKANQTIANFTLGAMQYLFGPYPLTATASSGLPLSYDATGKCMVNGNAITAMGAGQCSVTAFQAGNANYNPASATQTATVNRANTTLTISAAGTTSTDQPVTFLVKVIGSGSAGTMAATDGTLGFSDSSGAQFGRFNVQPIASDGWIHVQQIISQAGYHVVLVDYSGGTDFLPTASGFSYTVAAATPAGSNVTTTSSVSSGTISTTFDSVNSTGQTTVTVINTGNAGVVPGGFLVDSTSIAFDITTTASYSGAITSCFALPSITDQNQFNTLRILHREAVIAADGSTTYQLVDRTILSGPNAPNFNTKTICASTASLSPFVLAKVVDLTPPVVSSVSVVPNPAALGTSVVLSASVSDRDTGNSNIARIEYSLDNAATWTAVPGSYYSNPVQSASVTLTLPVGVYGVCVRGTDVARNAANTCTDILAIYDPNGNFVTGGGWIASPQGAYTPNPSLTGKATFGFVSKYQKGANLPSGDTQFQFDAAGFVFRSTAYEWLVVAGARAQFKGTGTVNSSGNYGFLLTAVDGQIRGGGGVDKFRIKIWQINPGGSEGGVIYDNQIGASDTADPTTALGGGSIVIHQ